MPELAVFVLIGLLVCAISTVIVYMVEMRRFSLFEASHLQKNLSKIDKRWNSLKQMIESNTEANLQAQQSSMTFTIFVFGIGMSLLSWFGLFMFLVTYLSIRLMGGSRLEIQLLKELNHRDMDRSDVQSAIETISNRN